MHWWMHPRFDGSPCEIILRAKLGCLWTDVLIVVACGLPVADLLNRRLRMQLLQIHKFRRFDINSVDVLGWKPILMACGDVSTHNGIDLRTLVLTEPINQLQGVI